jgi:hypothetical protein
MAITQHRFCAPNPRTVRSAFRSYIEILKSIELERTIKHNGAKGRMMTAGMKKKKYFHKYCNFAPVPRSSVVLINVEHENPTTDSDGGIWPDNGRH